MAGLRGAPLGAPFIGPGGLRSSRKRIRERGGGDNEYLKEEEEAKEEEEVSK